MSIERRVKIVATLGPAVASPDRLSDLLRAGADMVRINAAHGSAETRARLIADVRAAAVDVGKKVPILFDLRGLKIRTGPLAPEEPSERDGRKLSKNQEPQQELGPEEHDDKFSPPKGVPFARGSEVEIYPEPVPARPGQIGIDYPDLLDVIGPGSRMLISDGLIELLVDRLENGKAICKVSRGGLLLGKQGVTLPGAAIVGGSMTAADREDVAFAVSQGVDFLGLSFINDASDLVLARGVAAAHGPHSPGLIAKIERPDALNNVREIASQADGLMVARGDLGVQLPPEQVPRAQKKIISTANNLGVPVITATQMLESMITQPMATRAETSDVANAVWDGTDAVMLSAETAVGQFPVEAVETMTRIILEAERDGPIRTAAAAEPLPSGRDVSLAFADAIARATFALAETAPAEHILVFTLTGTAARRVAKYRPRPPIIAVTTDEGSARRLNLVWGVRAVVVPLETDPDKMFRIAGRAIIEEGLAHQDEYALIVGSLPMMKVAGRTNLVHVRKLGT
ncbi:MAG: pyruvate kinase [Thermomicrobiales bacterium]|nr:pyruvate kinase [Thermomicrobiales bacterium]